MSNDSQNDYIEPTKLPGVYIVKRLVFEDTRGTFRELFRKQDLDDILGYEFKPVQANHSRSVLGTLRGIHCAPWHKLVTIINGAAQQVVVDLRPDSPTFSQHITLKLDDSNPAAVFIPAGCGNAFLVTANSADYLYLTTDYWTAGKEQSVIYNDSDLNIKWELDNPLLSEKDLSNPSVRTLFPDKFHV